MKQRVQIDVSLVVVAIFLTALFSRYPRLYLTNLPLDVLFDFTGIFVILEGTFTRMSARGHKKALSNQSTQLVTTGPYQFTRNPMYLGSFLIGLGFAMILWPWWSIPLFVWIFLTRFNQQIQKEEEFLSETFGGEYEAYCLRAPRFFPSFKTLSLRNIDPAELINIKELFSTKEKFGILAWPVSVIVLKTFQEISVFGVSDLSPTIFIFSIAILNYAVCFMAMYKLWLWK